MKELVSIIIVNYNGGKFLSNLLKSLKAQTYTNFEIVMVDNASKDDSMELINTFAPLMDIKLIANNVNYGFAKANNIGIKQSRGEIVVLLNYDTIVDRDWLSHLVSDTQNSEADIYGSKILFYYPYAYLQFNDAIDLVEIQKYFSQNILWKEKNIWQPIQKLSPDPNTEIAIPLLNYDRHFGDDKYKLKKEDLDWIKKQLNVDFSLCDDSNIHFHLNSSGLLLNYKSGIVSDKDIYQPETKISNPQRFGFSGCCFLFRKGKMPSPLFKESYFMYYEDADLFSRLNQHDTVLSYSDNSCVYHLQSVNKQTSGSKYRYYLERNRLRFLKSYHNTYSFGKQYFLAFLYTMKVLMIGLKEQNLSDFKLRFKALIDVFSSKARY